MTDPKETHRFQADVSELLKLVVHSLYTEKEIFLRELLSNAFDALEKLRFRAISEPGLLAGEPALEVRITPDAEAGTLTIEDTGIGMSHDELAQNLGTIAHSGSRAFLDKLKDQQGKQEKQDKKEDSPTLIGQFGVGFYSAYLVADRVEVKSLAAGSRDAYVWTSDAKDSYTIEPTRKVERGTAIVLYLRDDQKKYLEDWEIRQLVRQYSDFVSHPVKLKGKDGYETINQATALWQRSPSDVTTAQYEELYKHLTHDFDAPFGYTHFRIEGTQLFSGILFFPKRPPFELYAPAKRGVRLYVKRVFIMEDCDALLPQWLRFVRGVIDSDDLPLNVSRELLQDSSIVRTIKKQVTRKALDRLEQLATESAEDFRSFWQTFGPVVKEGIAVDTDHKDRIAALAIYKSTKHEATTLDAYVERMAEGQKAIYYVIGDPRVMTDAPQLEALKKRGHEVLLMGDPVDEWAIEALDKYKDKPFVSAMRADLDLDAVPEEKTEKAKPLVARIKATLGDRVGDVTVTSRLTESPCCLVLPRGAHHAPIEKMLLAAGQKVPKAKRILEVNPDSTVVSKLAEMIDKGDPAADRWIETLYDQAILAEGGQPEDPVRFARRVVELLESAAR